MGTGTVLADAGQYPRDARGSGSEIAEVEVGLQMGQAVPADKAEWAARRADPKRE